MRIVDGLFDGYLIGGHKSMRIPGKSLYITICYSIPLYLTDVNFRYVTEENYPSLPVRVNPWS